MRLSRKQAGELDALATKVEQLGPGDFGSFRAGPAAGRGRPSLTGPSQRSPMLHVRVPAPLHRRIESEAHRRGMSLSEVVREKLSKVVGEERSGR